MSRTLSGPWTLYRKKADAALWMWFQLLCTDQGRSLSSAITEAVTDWVRKNDPDETWRQEWAEQ